jgi:hypothetical protein
MENCLFSLHSFSNGVATKHAQHISTPLNIRVRESKLKEPAVGKQAPNNQKRYNIALINQFKI